MTIATSNGSLGNFNYSFSKPTTYTTTMTFNGSTEKYSDKTSTTSTDTKTSSSKPIKDFLQYWDDTEKKLESGEAKIIKMPPVVVTEDGWQSLEASCLIVPNDIAKYFHADKKDADSKNINGYC